MIYTSHTVSLLVGGAVVTPTGTPARYMMCIMQHSNNYVNAVLVAIHFGIIMVR